MDPQRDTYFDIFTVTNGVVLGTDVTSKESIFPVVYLKDGLTLYAGDGSEENPYNIDGFSVMVDEEKDSISVSKDSELHPGTKVTITVQKEGHELKRLSIVDSHDNEIEFTKKSDTEYEFVMPASDVRVLAEFLEIKKEETPKEETSNEEKKNPNTIDMIILAMVILTISLFAGIYFYIKYSNNKEN